MCGCSSSPPAEAEKNVEDTEIGSLAAAVVAVQPVRWPTFIRTQGTLVADELAVVGAKVAGRVQDVHFDLGDPVAEDAPLVTLDQTEFRLQIAQSEALLLQARAAMGLKPEHPVDSLSPEKSPPVLEAKAVWDEARARVERWRRLREQRAVTDEEYEQALAAEKVAESRYASAINGANEKMAQIAVQAADLAVAQQRLDDSVTAAPFVGLVQQRHVAPGTFVQIGQPLMTLVRTDVLRFRGVVPDRHAHHVAVGQRIALHLDSHDEPIEASITRISPTIDQLSRSLTFEADVKNPDGRLRSGTFGEADLMIDPDAESLVLQRSAVREFAGVEKVWKVVDGTAQEQVVETGQRRDGSIEITSGLVAGDVVLVDAEQGRVARIQPLPGSSVAVQHDSSPTRAAAPANPVEGG